LTDSTSVVTVLFILMMMYILCSYRDLLWGRKAGVDKDCGDHTIYNLIVIFIIFVFNNVLKCLYWTGSLISKTVKDVSDDIKDVSLRSMKSARKTHKDTDNFLSR
jgi:hypothetical protein